MTSQDVKDLKILIVDDDVFMLKVLVSSLEILGYRDIQTATRGTTALALLESEIPPIDFLLCDLNMPEMDGVEFLRHLGGQGFDGNIALMSGEGRRILKTAETLAEAHHLNILGALEKPVSQSELGEFIYNSRGAKPTRQAGFSEPISEQELRQGIAGNELTVVFQPKLEITTFRLIGVESLVRWQHPERGIVGPCSFIPLAEKCGLIDSLTDVVFVKALRQGGEWKSRGLDVKVSINISFDSLVRLDLPEFISSSAQQAGLAANDIILEVTESRLMEDPTAALEILTRLRLKGFELSIDDFGTGYSSMKQLQQIPFSEMKIDRAFVNGAAKEPAARAILESSVDLAKKLKMVTVAEGVETQDDWALVAALGVDLVQGYFVAKPMPGHEMMLWYETYREGFADPRPQTTQIS